MEALLLTCLLWGGVASDGPCERCDAARPHGREALTSGRQRGLLYRHARPDSSRNGMPQTCYDPRFGCYPGNNRSLHRLPAFHGTFYRHPYNYRQLMEYPWHATPHAPEPLVPGYQGYPVSPPAFSQPDEMIETPEE